MVLAWLSRANGSWPWASGFPEYVTVFGDIHLPWVYGNAVLLRWLDADFYHVWIKVPVSAAQSPERRQEWAGDIERLLAQRLALANWRISAEKWWLCPNSTVFASSARDEKFLTWKNWHWISPETVGRLDISARLEREAEAYRKLVQWRNDQLKKQGVGRDSSLHAP